jgi:GntR family transcriptional regulator, arabinose operon transcriptional repressor
MQITRIQQLGVLAPYQKIKEDMLDLINKRFWQEGENIPVETALAAKYNVSRVTIRKALKVLENDGILVARQGAGRVVAKVQEVKERSKSIGIICNQFGSSYGEVDVINALAEKHGYKVHLYLLQEMTSNESLTQQLLQMTDEDISGIIILCRDVIGSQIIEWNRYVPIVAVYQDFSTAGIPSFNINWRWIAYEAACLMFETGFDKQLILLNDLPFFKHVDDMIHDGFNYAHHRYGKQMNDDQIFYMPSERQPNYLKRLDEVYPQITAQSKCGIFSYWNWPLTHLINYCRDQNFAIPDKVSLIGAIDSEMLRTAPLAITAFEYDREKLVENAFNSLLERIKNKEVNKNNGQITQIYGKLIKRSTTLNETRI